jgi:hypothetical protein
MKSFHDFINKEKQIQKVIMVLVVMFLSTLLIGCGPTKGVKGEAMSKKPVNYATAEADIKELESEKADTVDQIAAGVSSISPIGLVVNAAQETTETKAKVAIGDW